MNFFRCGIEKLTPGYDRHAFNDVLFKLLLSADGTPLRVLLLSSSLRFLAAGSTGGACERWLRMNVEMSRNSVLCAGFSSSSLIISA